MTINIVTLVMTTTLEIHSRAFFLKKLSSKFGYELTHTNTNTYTYTQDTTPPVGGYGATLPRRKVAFGTQKTARVSSPTGSHA